jgi:hypothetical protein
MDIEEVQPLTELFPLSTTSNKKRKTAADVAETSEIKALIKSYATKRGNDIAVSGKSSSAQLVSGSLPTATAQPAPAASSTAALNSVTSAADSNTKKPLEELSVDQVCKLMISLSLPTAVDHVRANTISGRFLPHMTQQDFIDHLKLLPFQANALYKVMQEYNVTGVPVRNII